MRRRKFLVSIFGTAIAAKYFGAVAIETAAKPTPKTYPIVSEYSEYFYPANNEFALNWAKQAGARAGLVVDTICREEMDWDAE